MTTDATTSPTETPPADTEPGRGRRIGIGLIFAVTTLALIVVLGAPMALSAQDLYAWAASPGGLDLGPAWALLVPLALDMAAVVCICFAVLSVWRRERPGIFSALVWVFAGSSAFAQYRHGMTERVNGGGQDIWWAMPLFAILGVLLLEVVLSKLRTWARKAEGEQHNAAAGFGVRWLVSPWETLQAWAASRREGISRVDDAVKFVRERRAVQIMDEVDAVTYAFSAIGVVDKYAARLWLQARKVHVTQLHIDLACEGLPIAPSAPVSGGPSLESSRPDMSVDEGHRTRLAALPTLRDRISYAFAANQSYDVDRAVAFLRLYGHEPHRSEFYKVRGDRAAAASTRGSDPRKPSLQAV